MVNAVIGRVKLCLRNALPSDLEVEEELLMSLADVSTEVEEVKELEGLVLLVEFDDIVTEC